MRRDDRVRSLALVRRTDDCSPARRGSQGTGRQPPQRPGDAGRCLLRDRSGARCSHRAGTRL